MANYQSNFVNLSYSSANKMYEAGLSKDTCPLFSDGDKVYVIIKERETQSGKKIKGTLVINPTGEYNNYGEPLGQFVGTLWENVNENTGKVSWSTTFEKGLCWLSLYQQQSDNNVAKYSLRVSWDADSVAEQDVSKDEVFGKDESKPTTPDLPF